MSRLGEWQWTDCGGDEREASPSWALESDLPLTCDVVYDAVDGNSVDGFEQLYSHHGGTALPAVTWGW